MADLLHLTVVTPERALIDETVAAVCVPGAGGYLGVLPGHAPLFSELQTGVLEYTRDGRTETLVISRGFMEVLENDVRVLANVAESRADIDVERAAASGKRAEERIASGSNDTDYLRAQESFERAATRLKVAGK